MFWSGREPLSIFHGCHAHDEEEENEMIRKENDQDRRGLFFICHALEVEERKETDQKETNVK